MSVNLKGVETIKHVTNLSRIEDSFIYIQLCRDQVKPATMNHKISQSCKVLKHKTKSKINLVQDDDLQGAGSSFRNFTILKKMLPLST